jgi:hypothetical protein
MYWRGIAALAHDTAESGYQFGAGGAQFVVMMERQFGENFFSFRGEREQDLAAVVSGAGATNKAARFQAVDEFDGAMVADLHAAGQFADARAYSGRHTFDGQHKLILAALEAGLLHHFFTEVQEAADLVTELRHRLLYRAAIQ